MKPKTQDDLVTQSKGYVDKEIERVVKIPGIQQLHTQPISDIAEVLANVLRMESGITQLTWDVGDKIVLKINPNL